MPFINIRQGSQLYILHKGASPYVEVGTIDSVTNMPMMGFYPNMPMMPIDLSIRIGEKVMPFKQLPANAETANVVAQNSGEEVCIACTKDAVNAEVQTLMQKSVDALNSVDYHKQRIETCKTLLDQLNPEKVREAQQAQRINDLEGQLAEMRKMLESMSANGSPKPRKE